MRNFIENCSQLNGMAAGKKGIFAKHLEERISEPADLRVTYEHFRKWLDGYPRADRYIPPVDSEALRQEAFTGLLARIILYAWEMADGTDLNAYREASRKSDARALAEGLIEAGLIPDFAHDGAVASRIPFGAQAEASDIVYVGSSNGVVIADRQGYAISVDCGWKDADAAIPAKFDFAEYEQHYGHSIPDTVDILDLGFASWDGEIIKPAHDWREMMAEDRARGE